MLQRVRLLLLLLAICSFLLISAFHQSIRRSSPLYQQQHYGSTRVSFHLYAKKRNKNIRLGDIPTEPVKANRPLRYKAVRSGGSGAKRIRSQGVKRDRELINPNRLRIIAGTARGKKIDSPDVYLRPMMAKVREAVFSTLGFMGLFEANTTRVLDVFSGSGSIGLEALSRGACHTTFVDFSSNCIETALKNAEKCGFQYQVKGVCATAQSALTNPAAHGLHEPYQLITLTPPYEEVIYKELIDAVCNSPLVVEDTIIVIEYPEEMGTLPHIIGGEDELIGLRNRRYGRTVLAMYAYRPSRAMDMRPDEFL